MSRWDGSCHLKLALPPRHPAILASSRTGGRPIADGAGSHNVSRSTGTLLRRGLMRASAASLCLSNESRWNNASTHSGWLQPISLSCTVGVTFFSLFPSSSPSSEKSLEESIEFFLPLPSAQDVTISNPGHSVSETQRVLAFFCLPCPAPDRDPAALAPARQAPHSTWTGRPRWRRVGGWEIRPPNLLPSGFCYPTSRARSFIVQPYLNSSSRASCSLFLHFIFRN